MLLIPFYWFSVVKTKSEWQEREEKRDKHKWLVFSFHDFAWISFIWIFISLFHFFSFHSQGPYSFWHYLNGFFFLHFRFFTSLPFNSTSCQIKMKWFLFEYCENEMESNVIQWCLISFHLNHNESFGYEIIVFIFR